MSPSTSYLSSLIFSLPFNMRLLSLLLTSLSLLQVSSCPSGWVESVEGCFLLDYSRQTSWREAQDLCESRGGYLAESKTQAQQIFLVRTNSWNT